MPGGPQWNCQGAIYEDPVTGLCRHDPGMDGSVSVAAPGQKTISSVSGIVLSCDMLPGASSGESKCRSVDSGSGTVSVFVTQELIR